MRNANESKTEKVIVFGTFDGLHDGHRFFLREAKKSGDKLVVAVAKDTVIKCLKGHLPTIPLPNRIMNIKSENLADKVVPGDEKLGVWKILKKEKPDIICIGYDQTNLKKALEKEIKNLDWPIKIEIIGDYKGSQLHSSILKPKNQ